MNKTETLRQTAEDEAAAEKILAITQDAYIAALDALVVEDGAAAEKVLAFTLEACNAALDAFDEASMAYDNARQMNEKEEQQVE